MTHMAALLTLSMLVPTVTPSATQRPSDVQCALASNFAASASKDQKQKQVARDLAHFYLGRVDGRLNEAQFKAEIAAQKKVITAKNIGGIMESCLGVAVRRLRALQTMAR